MLAANNSACLAFDNVSYLPPWLSDAFCRTATGGGFSTRRLYTDDEEVLFNVQKPIMLNGIDDIANRGDLLDRAIVVHLPAIAEENRRPESEFWEEFERLRPQILGALFDIVSSAINNLDTVKMDGVPRMADFAKWVSAAESALGWPTGRFLEVYTRNRRTSNELPLDASLVAQAIMNAKGNFTNWSGTATEALAALDDMVDEGTRRKKAWPKSAASLSNHFRRILPNLRAVGIDVQFVQTSGTNSRKSITIRTDALHADATDARDACALRTDIADVTLTLVSRDGEPAQGFTNSSASTRVDGVDETRISDDVNWSDSTQGDESNVDLDASAEEEDEIARLFRGEDVMDEPIP
jgi:hypothetical protein